MAVNKMETMVIEVDRIDEAAALLDVARYVMKASRLGDDDLTLQDEELQGLDYLLAYVQAVLGKGRPE
jgi:hypothetical protein